jgi:hypothetical protein
MPHRTAALALGLAALASASIAQPVGAIDRLAWLTGCWAADGGEPGSVEHWLAPAAGSMLGVNRTVRAGRLSQFEFMAIRTAADGRLAFVAWPGGRNETEFPIKSLEVDEVVFESPRQAFPSRVIYRRTGDRSMLGRIEGVANGNARAVDFPFIRVSCPERGG